MTVRTGNRITTLPSNTVVGLGVRQQALTDSKGTSSVANVAAGNAVDHTIVIASQTPNTPMDLRHVDQTIVPVPSPSPATLYI